MYQEQAGGAGVRSRAVPQLFRGIETSLQWCLEPLFQSYPMLDYFAENIKFRSE